MAALPSDLRAVIFLSTPSARRATPRPAAYERALRYFYPRPPRGGRPLTCWSCAPPSLISIHALREEGDPSLKSARPSGRNFYPRPPRGGRLHGAAGFFVVADFYPRPPRGGRRAESLRPGRRPCNFYPRPPRGGRPSCLLHTSYVCIISIHALREEGDQVVGGILLVVDISIHALREEGDLRWTTLPDYQAISIHALREEGDTHLA